MRFDIFRHITFSLLLFLSVNLAFAQNGTSSEDSAIANCDTALAEIVRIFDEDEDSAVGLLHRLIGQYEEEQNLLCYARAQSLMSWFLVFEAKYQESIELGHKVLPLQRKIQDSVGLALTTNRLGVANIYFERLDDAEAYIRSALGYFEALGDSARIEMCFNNLGIIAHDRQRLVEAISHYEKAMKILRGMKNFTDLGYTQYNVGLIYLDLGQTKLAEKYMERSIHSFEELAAVSVPPMVNEGYGLVQRRKGNLVVATAHMQMAYQDAEEAGHTEIVLSAGKELAELLLEQERFREGSVILQRHHELKDSINSANNAIQVAEVEEQYKNAEKEAEIARLTNKQLLVENEAQKLRATAAYLGGGILVVALGFTMLLWYRRYKEQVRESRQQARLTEIKLMALRAQMNPHFIFNCINTAQNFVLAAEKKQACRYLSKFAKLLRMVLEHSGSSTTSLEDELEHLRLYIELEAVRFGNRFGYSIEVDPALQGGVYEIPSMVMQPIVENAILHGLINRENGGGLLKVALKQKDDLIECVIEDNGVGRQRAAEIKALKDVHYQSAAIPNVSERLDIISQGDAGARMETIDLYDGGVPSGTRVRVFVPWR